MRMSNAYGSNSEIPFKSPPTDPRALHATTDPKAIVANDPACRRR